jgi:hypothetical protein
VHPNNVFGFWGSRGFSDEGQNEVHVTGAQWQKSAENQLLFHEDIQRDLILCDG